MTVKQRGKNSNYLHNQLMSLFEKNAWNLPFIVDHSLFCYSTGTLLYQARQANSSVAQSAREEMVSPSPKLPQPHPVQQPEPFVPPEDLEIPSDMEIVSVKGKQEKVVI